MTREAAYSYSDENGTVLVRKVKYRGAEGEKTYGWEHRTGEESWEPRLNGWRPGLYCADVVREAVENFEQIWLCEGEKDADAMRGAGYRATSGPNGAGAWDEAWSRALIGVRQVVVVADDDEPGRRHAATVCSALVAVGVPALVVLPAYGYNDAADHLAAGNGRKGWRKPSEAVCRGWLVEEPATAQTVHEGETSGAAVDVGALLARAYGQVSTLGRNVAGFNLACQLRDAGLPQAKAEAVLIDQYVAPAIALGVKSGKPYPASEARESVRQAYSREARDPITGAVADDEVLTAVEAEFLVQLDEATDHLDDLIDDEGVAKLPPIEYVIDGWVPAGTYTVLFGPPGVGKTFALLGMARSVRRGTRWQDNATQQGSCLYYQGEGVRQFKDRISAWDERYPLRPDQTMLPGAYTERVVDLTKPEGVAAVIRTVRGYEAGCGTKIRLLVIDPLIEFMTGDENGEGMERVSRGLRALARLLDCGVVVGHHTNASGERERGAAFLRMRAGAFVRMEPVDEEGAVVGLLQHKQRNGEKLALTVEMCSSGQSVVLEWKEIMLAQDYVANREGAKKRKKDDQKEAVSAQKAGEMGSKVRKALAKLSDHSTKRVKQGEIYTAVGGNRESFKKALLDLQAQEVVVVVAEGPGRPVWVAYTEKWLRDYTGNQL